MRERRSQVVTNIVVLILVGHLGSGFSVFKSDSFDQGQDALRLDLLLLLRKQRDNRGACPDGSRALKFPFLRLPLLFAPIAGAA